MPESDWKDALPWPDKPGVWWMLEQYVHHTSRVFLVWACRGCNPRTGPLSVFHADGVHGDIMFGSCVKRSFLRCPVGDPPDPPKPPSPWDYQPKEGDWVWMLDTKGQILDHPKKVTASMGRLLLSNGLWVDSCLKHGERLAKAEVSDPPPVEESDQ